MKYDDGDNCNLFEFRKPNETALDQYVVPQSVEDLPPADARPRTNRKWDKRILVVIPQETTGAEFIGVRPVLRYETYHDVSIGHVTFSRTVVVHCIDHRHQCSPFGNHESTP